MDLIWGWIGRMDWVRVGLVILILDFKKHIWEIIYIIICGKNMIWKNKELVGKMRVEMRYLRFNKWIKNEWGIINIKEKINIKSIRWNLDCI